jgi:hypothetical protein
MLPGSRQEIGWRAGGAPLLLLATGFLEGAGPFPPQKFS